MVGKSGKSFHSGIGVLVASPTIREIRSQVHSDVSVYRSLASSPGLVIHNRIDIQKGLALANY